MQCVCVCVCVHASVCVGMCACVQVCVCACMCSSQGRKKVLACRTPIVVITNTGHVPDGLQWLSDWFCEPLSPPHRSHTGLKKCLA